MTMSSAFSSTCAAVEWLAALAGKPASGVSHNGLHHAIRHKTCVILIWDVPSPMAGLIRSQTCACRFDLVILPASPALMEPVMEVMALSPVNYSSQVLRLAAQAWPGESLSDSVPPWHAPCLPSLEMDR